jgi:hypothetical protein
MKLLIAVKSCQADMVRGDHQVIRDTWGKDIVGADLRFFVGAGETSREDEVNLGCPDEYHALPYKTRAILKWSINNGYDYSFLCDTDTFVIPNKLMQVNFTAFDYVGVNGRPLGVTFPYNAKDRNGVDHFISHAWPWASGGYGYFLSKKAAEYVVVREPDLWAEDMFVGSVLGPLYNEGKIKMSNMNLLEGTCTFHFPQHQYKSGYDPKFNWMPEMQAKYGVS